MCVLLLYLLAISDAAPLQDNNDVNILNQNTKNEASSVEAELGDHFEGDMLLTPFQREAISLSSRNGLLNVASRWPNNIVVYSIETDDFDEDQLKMIEMGMADIANKSCIKFRQREEDEFAVYIQGSQSGCFSNVGYKKSQDEEEENKQILNLSKRCFKHGTVVHEMLHTLGFFHMQSTYDRDDYVQILWENIAEKHKHNFKKYTNDTVTNFGVPYDYESVMHYPETAFSINNNKTIIPLQEGAQIGQRKGLSESDVAKLNKMYCELTDEDYKFIK